MSTLVIQNGLAEILIPLAIVGLVIAVASAILAVVAFSLDAAETGGVGVALWIVGLLLASTAGYVNNWIPVIVAVLAAMLVASAPMLARVVLTIVEKKSLQADTSTVTERAPSLGTALVAAH